MKEYTIGTLNLEMNKRIYNIHINLKWMKEYTFMFMNVHKKYAIYGKGDEGQNGTRKHFLKWQKLWTWEECSLVTQENAFSKDFL